MSAIDKFIDRFFDKETEIFNVSLNDCTLTRSGTIGENAFEKKCHVSDHIGDNENRKDWAVRKISTAIAYRKGDLEAKHGSYEPSWFDDEESLSDYLYFYLSKEKEAKKSKLLEWVNNRDINWSDRDKRYVVDLFFREVTGKAICAHTSYEDRFACHGVRFIFEYTAFLKDGEFALYNAYPILSPEDKKIVEKAKKDFCPPKKRDR